MACVNEDGTLSTIAREVLSTLTVPLSDKEIVAKRGLPLFRVRMSLRELLKAGLVSCEKNRYLSTDRGRLKLIEE